MFRHSDRMRAPFWGARFVFSVGILLTLLVHTSVAARCLPDRIDQTVRVSYVIDGDTVVLADRRRLRIIGIDTPELGHDGARDQPYAIEARDALRKLLFTHRQQLSLRLDVSRRDRYGRLLAHAFLDDGSSVAEHILQSGLATQLVIPPDLWQLDCYQAAELRAVDARRGLWSLSAYQPVESRGLSLDNAGYRRVRGRVVRIGESRGAIWLNMEGRFAVRIPRDDLKRFRGSPPRQWLNRRIEVRGKVYARKRELRITVRHPAAIHNLEQD